MLIIKNGMVIDPVKASVSQKDIYIEDGKIVKLVSADGNKAANNENSEGMVGFGALGNEHTEVDEIIDATGLYVAPGLVDVHVHFREPGFTHKEDIDTGSASAIKGGYTSVVLMANTKPAVDNLETLEYVKNRAKEQKLHVYTCANVTMGLKGNELTNMSELYANGAVGFTDDGIPILNGELLEKAFAEAVKLNVPISLHEENPEFIENNGVNRGLASEYYGIGGSDRQAEISMIKRDLEIALKHNGIIDIQHISTKEGVELVRNAKKISDRVHAEATPHHFTLTEEAVIEHGTNAKMNPPLRTAEDREAVRKGLQDGTIDMIATDHAPHSLEEKSKPITEAPSGIVGLETALSLAIRELIQSGIMTYPQLLHRMSTAPAKLYGLQAGEIEVDKPADLCIFSDKESWKVEKFASKASNSPFIGETLPGVVKYTICDGKVVYKEN